MNIDLYKRLHEEGLISAETLEKANQKHKNPLFSVHWELKTLLYLGVMLLSTGLGILVYKNIDTIGHQFILLFLAVISAGCFAYCIKHKKPFSREKVESPNSFFDYILLLGCLTLLSFLGYMQFQFHVFGDHYGLTTLIPTIILFYVAYEFDHLGVLGMAITSMALWMGVSLNPRSFLADNLFADSSVIYTYLAFGLILLIAGHLSAHYKFKKHFKFNYHHFGLNISFIALFAGFMEISGNYSFVWLVAVFTLAIILYFDAMKDRSFYFLLLIMIYSYVALSFLVLSMIFKGNDFTGIFIYFILSAGGFIVLLKKLNTKLKEDDHLQ